jgi:hypothetical protein
MKRSNWIGITGLIVVTITVGSAGALSPIGTSAAASVDRQDPVVRVTANALPHYVMWDLASDFGITATNPQPDSYGDANVWSWRQGSNLLHPSKFTLLHTYTTKDFGVTGLDSWHGPFASQPEALLPQVGINASRAVADGSTSSEMGGIFWPKNVVLVHPSPTSDAIIGWTSPATMTVTVTATVAKLDRDCGDGITWRLSDGGVKLTGGAIGKGGNPKGTVRAIPVSVGTTIYLEIGPASDHGYFCDSTGVSLTVTGRTG